MARIIRLPADQHIMEPLLSVGQEPYRLCTSTKHIFVSPVLDRKNIASNPCTKLYPGLEAARAVDENLGSDECKNSRLRLETEEQKNPTRLSKELCVSSNRNSVSTNFVVHRADRHIERFRRSNLNKRILAKRT